MMQQGWPGCIHKAEQAGETAFVQYPEVLSIRSDFVVAKYVTVDLYTRLCYAA